SAALKEADPAAEPVRVALLLEKLAMLGKRSGVGGMDPAADLRAALELVPAGLDDAARARVLVSEAKSIDKPCGPEAQLAAKEALTLARQAGDVATQAAAMGELAMIESFPAMTQRPCRSSLRRARSPGRPAPTGRCFLSPSMSPTFSGGWVSTNAPLRWPALASPAPATMASPAPPGRSWRSTSP